MFGGGDDDDYGELKLALRPRLNAVVAVKHRSDSKAPLSLIWCPGNNKFLCVPLGTKKTTTSSLLLEFLFSES